MRQRLTFEGEELALLPWDVAETRGIRGHIENHGHQDDG